jgi:cytochrome c biogenesis protein CcmG/thiol:disulfide interchange protein DsbE
MAGRGQWIAVATVVIVIGGIVGIGATMTSEAGLVGPGIEAPHFQAVNLVTGETMTLADYSGQVVLLNIWATWCVPCEVEMPSIQRLHETLGPKGLKVVAVSIDQADSEVILEWARERDLTFEILQDRDGRIERTYQTTGVPESFVIDRAGIIVKKEFGAREWDDPDILSMLTRLLENETQRAVSSDTLLN